MKEYFPEKLLLPFGIAGRGYSSAEEAKSFTYDNYAKEFPPTPLLCEANPYNENIKNAKHILEIGCGVGRNLHWIMENTKAHYYGVDPNQSMLEYFWEVCNQKWKDRVCIDEDIDFTEDMVFDIVLSIFVFQHIGYRPQHPYMNISDITKKIKKYTRPGTIWFMCEHDQEEPGWQQKWMNEFDIEPEVFVEDWKEFPELSDRDIYNLIIFKEK